MSAFLWVWVSLMVVVGAAAVRLSIQALRMETPWGRIPLPPKIARAAYLKLTASEQGFYARDHLGLSPGDCILLAAHPEQAPFLIESHVRHRQQAKQRTQLYLVAVGAGLLFVALSNAGMIAVFLLQAASTPLP